MKKRSIAIACLLVAVGIAIAASVLVSLTWTTPTTNEDGTPLTDLAGYRLYYGTVSRGTATSPATFTYQNVISIPSLTTQYQMTTLTTGTWYFSVTAVRANGIESNYSNEVFKRIDLSVPIPPIMNSPTGGVYL